MVLPGVFLICFCEKVWLSNEDIVYYLKHKNRSALSDIKYEATAECFKLSGLKTTHFMISLAYIVILKINVV